MQILETAAQGEGESEGGYERDELYDEAVRIVVETNQASISMIQRRLRIGYNRAARMVEQMEHEGLVMPADDGPATRSAATPGRLECLQPELCASASLQANPLLAGDRYR